MVPNVFCYNIQPGIVLDYATGDSQVDGNIVLQDSPVEVPPVVEDIDDFSENVVGDYDYVLNTNTMRFHYPDCTSVSEMKEKNKAFFTGSRDELIDKGYISCGRCKP